MPAESPSTDLLLETLTVKQRMLPPAVPSLTREAQLPSLPPSSNTSYRTRVTASGQHRGRVLSDEARSWQDLATLKLREQWADLPALPPQSRLSLAIGLAHPHILMWDLDNRLKLIKDALRDALGVDDRYVLELYVRKVRGNEQVYLSVMVLGANDERT